MDKEEITRIRQHLGKTQKQMAQLLGVSLRAVKSFEQGWRNIPVHAERQILFLLAMNKNDSRKGKSCWTTRKCSQEIKGKCPAFEYNLGHLCWFINGTICHGDAQEDWHKKMDMCRKCDVFKPILSAVKT